jgi:hypothetical protein
MAHGYSNNQYHYYDDALALAARMQQEQAATMKIKRKQEKDRAAREKERRMMDGQEYGMEFANHTITLKPKQDPVAVIRDHCEDEGCPEKVQSMLEVVYSDLMKNYQTIPGWQKDMVRRLQQHVRRL